MSWQVWILSHLSQSVVLPSWEVWILSYLSIVQAHSFFDPIAFLEKVGFGSRGKVAIFGIPGKVEYWHRGKVVILGNRGNV
jgi:hypothetical protein